MGTSQDRRTGGTGTMEERAPWLGGSEDRERSAVPELDRE